ncbi:MAG: glycosyltransferase family 4 protein [Planctomycetota bacterium]|nr:glycosyltransferase family 4 protein [Planctomycetota bacterium]
MTVVPTEIPPKPAAGKLQTLVYVLHSSDMYGTERVALATAQGLADSFTTIFMGPPGMAMEEARRRGFEALEYRTSKDLARILRPILRDHESFTFVATGPRYSFVCMALNVLYRRKIRQIQIVHGGAGEKQDYARKKFLSPFNIMFITVSDYSKKKLASWNVPADQIEIVLNFLPAEQVAAAPKRGVFNGPPKNAVVSSRTADLKRLDVLMDAMDYEPRLADFPIDVLGDGDELEKLRARALADHPNVRFHGYQGNVAEWYAKADLLVHTCPTEQFGLVIIEAFAARIPVLCPDQGGTACLVQDGVNGFLFRANDPRHLARRLLELRQADPQLLNRVVARAAEDLATKYSAEMSLHRYRELFSQPS